VARLLLSHELTILSRLKGIDGVAEESFRIDGNSLAILFQEGEVLANIQPERVTAQYLIKLEELTREIHRAGVVHLDMRTYSNILIRPDDTPAVIDFQAAQTTWWMPSFLRKKLEDIDMSGAYKKWERFQPGLMGEERKRELVRINKLRDLWVIRGYFGAHVKKEKR
jgi:RIO-like serine/threonine protein kinase